MSGCSDLYATWVEPLRILFNVFILGVATGAISLLLTKSPVFNFLHDWLDKHSPFFGKMLDCPWCTSHWVALFFVLVYRPLLLDGSWRPAWLYASWLNYLLIPVDYLVTVMVLVAISSVIARTIYSAYKPLMGE